MRLLHVGSLPAADSLIGQTLWALDEARRRTLALLSDDLRGLHLDWRPAPTLSSAGDLLYHIAAIELDWLVNEVREAAFPEDVGEWFPVDVRDDQGRLSKWEGEGLGRHLARLNWVRGELLQTFSAMSPGDFVRPRQMEAYAVTPQWVAAHLSLHEAHHAGQLTLLHRLRLEAEPLC